MFYVGDTIRISAAITDSATDAAADPSSVVVKVRNPQTGETASHTATRVTTGSYRADITAGVSGTWRYRVEASGVVSAVIEGAYVVNPSRV